MNDDPLVDKLLEELLQTGGDPDEACRTWPELLPKVKTRLQRLRRLEEEVGAMFPPCDPAGAATPASPPPGELPHILGYEVQRVLGRGGMGVVYAARHLRLDRSVALKMLLAGPYAGLQELERFLREAQAVAGLRHPNVVQLYDVGDVDGHPYFTMELVEGGSLARKLAESPLPAREAAALVATVAEAIQAAHDSGIVHRDLKPANVLLTADGRPKVTDFGLARRLERDGELTLSGAPMGTPNYMSPEQARGDKDAIGPATDVYALGAILYECLTGRPPFRAESAAATLQQVLDNEPVPPARLNPRVPRDLDTICLKCLHKEPLRRYASATALAEDLRRFECGEPIVARPVGRLERAAKWCRRRPAAAAILAAGLMLAAGVTAASVWYVGDRTRLRHEGSLRDAEVQNRSRQVNREAVAALDQAELHLTGLRNKVDDPWQVRELLSDLDQWQSQLEQARQACQRAQSACVGNEALVTEESRARFRKVQAALSSEETSFRLVTELDAIAADALTSGCNSRPQTAIANYTAFFARQGMDIGRTDKARLVSMIRSSPIRFALVDTLDLWADITAGVNPKDPKLAIVLGVAREADSDPWRDRFRDLEVWRNADALSRLAGEVDVQRQPPTIMASLCRLLTDSGQDATALYRRAIFYHPRDFWLRFRAAFDAKDPGPAAELYLAALAIRPNSARAFNNLAIALRNQKDLQGGMAAARRAVELSPTFAGAHNTLGNALGDRGDTPRAIAAYRKAVELDPNYFQGFMNLGKALCREKDFAGAVAAYRKATEIDRTSALAFQFLGASLRDRHDARGAVAACRKATELDPNSAAAFNELGLSLRDLGKSSDAIAAFRKSSELDPHYARAMNNLGLALQDHEDLPGAIAALRKAIEIDPTLAAAYNNLGIALWDNKDRTGAITAYKKAIELDPHNGGPLANLGIAFARLENYPGAVAALQKAAALDPNSPKIYSNLGLALQANKDLPGALAAFRKAIELDPGSCPTHFQLGRVLYLWKQYAEAVRAYREALKAEATYHPACNELAWILATCPEDKIRDGKRAIEYATRACELTHWKVGDYVDTLAAAYAEAGQFNEAIRYQKKALADPAYEARLTPEVKRRLELYEHRKPSRDQ
jgi:eukaryotic-like serine/threonine-protein kinase